MKTVSFYGIGTDQLNNKIQKWLDTNPEIHIISTNLVSKGSELVYIILYKDNSLIKN